MGRFFSPTYANLTPHFQYVLPVLPLECMVESVETQDEQRLFRIRVCRMENAERLTLVVGPDHLLVPTPMTAEAWLISGEWVL